MKSNTLINGEYEQLINSLDRGFQYGDGLFETILVESNTACFLKEHIQRLQKGCEVLGLPPVNVGIIEREISQLISTTQYGVIKLILSRGVGERGFTPPTNPILTRVVSFVAAEVGVNESLSSVDLTLCHTRLSRQPLLAGIKHLNQLERVLARRELGDKQQLEGLMLDENGLVIEGTMSNIFIVNKGVLMTPELSQSGVLGVIREYLIRQARQEDIDCQITELTLDDLINADEIFMTNSLMPVRRVKQFSIDGVFFTKNNDQYTSWALNSVYQDIQRQVDLKRLQH